MVREWGGWRSPFEEAFLPSAFTVCRKPIPKSRHKFEPQELCYGHAILVWEKWFSPSVSFIQLTQLLIIVYRRAVSIHYPLMLSAPIGDSDMEEQTLWLSSVSAGILMCITVYHVTGTVSSICFKGYYKLQNPQKVEWNNRGFSTFHAVIVTAAALHMLVFSDLFKDDPVDGYTGYIVDRRSTYSNTVLGISVGYFLSDLAMILWNYPSLGGKEYILHHGLSLASIITAHSSGQCYEYILMFLSSEVTTPFVNLRWYLDVMGKKKSKLYAYNGVALFVVWLVARILVFVYIFVHIFTHFDQVKTFSPVTFYGLLLVPPVLALMNIFWFWKISKGLIKTLLRATHQS